MKYHTLKIKQMWYQRIVLDDKTCELRKNDKDYQVGDIIRFEVINEGQDMPVYEPEEYKITHVLTSDTCEGLEDGYCVLSIMKHNILSLEENGN